MWLRGDFAFSSDGQRLAAPMRDDPSTVGLWDAADGRQVATFRGPEGAVTAVALSGDGRRLAAATRLKARAATEVTVWDLATARPLAAFDVGPRVARAAALSDDGRKVAAGGQGSGESGGWVAVRDADTGATLGELGDLQAVMSLAFHPDGERLAAADFGGPIVVLWDLASGAVVRQPAPQAVSCVAFSPDGRRLASMGYDAHVHLADARTALELIVLRSTGPSAGTKGYTPRLVFSPDGTRIVANGYGHLSVWKAGPPPRPAAGSMPGDLAGWLRLSRDLAGRGDAKGSAAALEQARALPAGEPLPWVEHAVVLARGRDPAGARAAFDRALASPLGDPMTWLACEGPLRRSGLGPEADAVRDRARALAERRLAGPACDEGAIETMIQIMDELPPAAGEWVTLHPSAGRFRLAVTNRPSPLPDSRFMMALKDQRPGGWTRLGMAHVLHGHWADAAAALERSAAASSGTGLDRFLLALCYRRLGRPDEAQRWYGLGLDWLKRNGADETLRAVVIEATAEIEGTSRGDAEARLFLDPDFPADPFAR
jgi:WD40 repeat protein/tetratricopeptide (TPR) repeat protein